MANNALTVRYRDSMKQACPELALSLPKGLTKGSRPHPRPGGRPEGEVGGDKMGNMRQRYIVNEGGKRTAIVLPMTAYKRLLEDIHDLAVVAERRHEPTLPLEEVRRRLQADGTRQDLAIGR